MKISLQTLLIVFLTALLSYDTYAQAPTISYPAIAPSNTVAYTDGTAITPLVPSVSGATSAGLSIPIAFASVPTPRGVATDATGSNVYAVDMSDGLVYKYTAAGVGGIFNIKPAKITSPRAIAFDGLGNILIADSGATAAKRGVYVYNAAGTALQISSALSNTNLDPEGIAVDASNNIYVADYANNKILKFTLTSSATPGAYTYSLTTMNISPAIVHPAGIAITGNNIYVSQDNGASSNVVELVNGVTNTGVNTPVIITLPSTSCLPKGLGTDGSGNIYVGDVGTNSILYIAAGTTARAATTRFTGINVPWQVISYGSGASQVLYTADNGNSFIDKSTVGTFSINKTLPPGLSFDPASGTISGTPSQAFASTTYLITAYNGTSYGSVSITISVSSSKPSISYTPQSSNLNVGVTMTPLTPVNIGGTVHPISFTTPGTVIVPHTDSQPHGLYVDSAGYIYVANEATGGAVDRYSPGGALVGTLGTGFVSPIGVTMDNLGNAYVIDANGAGLNGLLYKVPAGGGTPILLESGLPQPYGITIDGAGFLYIADAAGGDVEKFSTAGGPALLQISPPKVTKFAGITGVVVDDNFNIYALDYNNKIVQEYDKNGIFITTFITGLSFPLGIAIDDANNIYITDTGLKALNVYTPSGVKFFTYTSSSGLYDPEGISIDRQNDLYITDNSNFTVTKFVPSSGYFISPVLPTGLSFNGNTGVFSGKPTVSFPKTNYTVSAVNTSGTGTFVVTLACFQYIDWLGAGISWTVPSNWSTGTVPLSSDSVRIGNVPFSNPPTLNAPASVTSLIMGNKGGQSPSINVASAGVLNILGNLTYQSDANSNLGYIAATIAGAGTVNANSVSVISNTHITGSSYTDTLKVNTIAFNITNNLALTSSQVGSDISNAAFVAIRGTTKLGGALQTTNTGGGTSTFSVAPTTTATLQLAGAAALSGLSATGTNVVKFNNTGTTVEYSGTVPQTVYTDAAITGLPGGVGYQTIKFSGPSKKTVSAGNLNIAADFNNTMTTDATNYVDLTLPVVNFNGTTQNIASGSGLGTTFTTVNFSGTGTKTLTTGKFNVASTGILTMAGTSSSTILASNSLLTLISDVNGSATIPTIGDPANVNSYGTITGTVNVQRFITGGAGYRGYRLLSSPVYQASLVFGSNHTNVYSINYLSNSSYLTGPGGGFDKVGNPTLYLFREDIVPNSTSFISGNYWGITTINNTPNYYYNLNSITTPTYNIPAGAGYNFFFRGDRSVTDVTTETSTNYVPTNTILTASGTLNQGPVKVIDWYNNTSPTLGYTVTTSGSGNNSSVRGFNLVGNPYPSSIDFDKLDSIPAHATTAGIYVQHLAPFMYIFNVKTQNYVTYQAGHGGGGTSIPNANIIPSGQGFLVQATTAAATLTFNEAAKTNSQATTAIGNLLLGAPPQAVERQYINVMMQKDSNNYDGTLIDFESNAHGAYYLGEDAPYKSGAGKESIFSISSDNVPLAINTLSLQKQTATRVPLNVNATTDGIYNLNLTELKGLPAIYDVWLMDAYKKDSLDFKNNPNYSFNIYKNDTTSFGSKRFTLVIRENPALGLHLLNFTANKTSGGSQVVWKTENEQNYTNFTLERSIDNGVTFNILGGFASSAQGTYSFLDKNPVIAADEYRLKMIDLNSNVSYSNVVTLMYANTLAGNNISVYPNPASNTIHLSILSNSSTSGGTGITLNSLSSTASSGATTTYSIKIVNVTGSVIKTATSSSPNWEDNVTGLSPGTYFIQVLNNTDNSEVGKSTFVKL